MVTHSDSSVLAASICANARYVLGGIGEPGHGDSASRGSQGDAGAAADGELSCVGVGDGQLPCRVAQQIECGCRPAISRGAGHRRASLRRDSLVACPDRS
jgi:hypothetical protein